jgi:hypothetical protein
MGTETVHLTFSAAVLAVCLVTASLRPLAPGIAPGMLSGPRDPRRRNGLSDRGGRVGVKSSRLHHVGQPREAPKKFFGIVAAVLH